MNVVGVVSEFNPMHYGHKWFLNKIREKYGDNTAIVCVMSGDFVQRGEPACMDKFSRAKAAVLNGADLVIELPIPWSISSAERFAENAVRILASINSVSTIAFGSECGDADKIIKTAEAILTDKVNKKIKDELNGGINYALARQKAMEYYYPELAEIISTPNNLLGVEYAKAIIRNNYGMDVYTVKRHGVMHDSKSDSNVKSAKEIREILKTGGSIEKFVSDATLSVIKECIENNTFIYDNDNLEIAIVSRLRMLSKDDYNDIPDSDGGVGNAVYKAVQDDSNIQGIAMKAKSKNVALARINRMLMCAATEVKKEDIEETPKYLRVLASTERGLEILRGKNELPVLAKAADVGKISCEAKKQFELGSKAHDLYVLGYNNIQERKCGQDYRNGPYIIKSNDRK